MDRCAAQRVEPVYRVAGHERHAIDGGFRNEVPVDDVAKNFVDADAVLIDGQALRRADDGRGGKAAIVEVALKLVPGLIAERLRRASLRDIASSSATLLGRFRTVSTRARG